MKLIDLDPRWLMQDGKRIGFVFRSPTDRKWWQSCFVAPTERREQWRLIEAAIPPDEKHDFQACKPSAKWKVAGGIKNADFATISVTPSLDGSPGGLWHGHITGGEIKGGLS